MTGNELFLLEVIYFVLNLIAFLLYGVDKSRAVKDQWRIKESTLLFFSALGAIGAVLGMKTFRHKTNKPKFKLVYLFFAIHIILLVWLFSRQIGLF